VIETTPATFREPMINIYSHDVTRLIRFYEGLGFRETFVRLSTARRFTSN
jgi:hypothetical protein